MGSGCVSSSLQYVVSNGKVDNSKGLMLVDPPVKSTFSEDTLSPYGKQKDARLGQCEVGSFRGRYVDILDPTPKTIDSLTNLNLPAGVDVEIKMS